MQLPFMLVQFLASLVGFVVHGVLFGAGFALGAVLVERELEKRLRK